MTKEQAEDLVFDLMCACASYEHADNSNIKYIIDERNKARDALIRALTSTEGTEK